MLQFFKRPARSPSRAEEAVFEAFAAEARSVGTALARDARFVATDGAALDLREPRDAAFALLVAATFAREYLARREHLLVLIERVAGMIDAGARRAPPQGRLEAGLQLLRAAAMAELLVLEASERFRGHAATMTKATAAMSCLATGVAARLGTDLPHDFSSAFPRFAKAVQAAAHPARAVASNGLDQRARLLHPQ